MLQTRWYCEECRRQWLAPEVLAGCRISHWDGCTCPGCRSTRIAPHTYHAAFHGGDYVPGVTPEVMPLSPPPVPEIDPVVYVPSASENPCIELGAD